MWRRATGAVHRVLTRLADARRVSVERVGNQTYYQANRAGPVFEELHGLILETSGLLGPRRAALVPLAGRIRARADRQPQPDDVL